MEHTHILKYLRLIQLCMDKNDHFALCTTGPTHISCKLIKYKYICKTFTRIITLQTLYVFCRSILKFYNKIHVTFYSLGDITGTARMMGNTKVWVGSLVYKSIFKILIYAEVDQATIIVNLTHLQKKTSIIVH